MSPSAFRAATPGSDRSRSSASVELHGRIDRGVTRSIHLIDPNGYEIELVYELPREMWEGDIDAALNQAVERPIEA